MLTYEKYFQPASARSDVLRLRDIVEDYDAIFLLNDTRICRYLPTMMARALGKTLISASLVLDCSLSFDTASSDAPLIAWGDNSAAPENYTRDRTIDQKCAVPRWDCPPWRQTL